MFICICGGDFSVCVLNEEVSTPLKSSFMARSCWLSESCPDQRHEYRCEVNWIAYTAQYEYVDSELISDLLVYIIIFIYLVKVHVRQLFLDH